MGGRNKQSSQEHKAGDEYAFPQGKQDKSPHIVMSFAYTTGHDGSVMEWMFVMDSI